MKTGGISVLVLVAWACAALGQEDRKGEAVFSFETNRCAVTVRQEKDGTVFLITGPSGICSATITLGAGVWPERAALKLRYSPERPFTNLEGLTIRTSNMVIGASSHRGAGFQVHAAGREAGDAERIIGSVALSFEAEPDALRITLPMEWIRDEKRFSIECIDWYRQ